MGLLFRGMWDLPGPGLKPMFRTLAGRFLTTVPPGKSHCPGILPHPYYEVEYVSSPFLLNLEEYFDFLSEYSVAEMIPPDF